jgi:hypothetical protein
MRSQVARMYALEFRASMVATAELEGGCESENLARIFESIAR